MTLTELLAQVEHASAQARQRTLAHYELSDKPLSPEALARWFTSLDAHRRRVAELAWPLIEARPDFEPHHLADLLESLTWHDLDKYNLEFAYARQGGGDYRRLTYEHYHRHAHHWQMWHGQEMTRTAFVEMIADWRATSERLNDDPLTYYRRNRTRLQLHPRTRRAVERELGYDPTPAPTQQLSLFATPLPRTTATPVTTASGGIFDDLDIQPLLPGETIQTTVPLRVLEGVNVRYIGPGWYGPHPVAAVWDWLGWRPDKPTWRYFA